ncbi:MAG: hypothetical protein ACI94Y_001575 [Maribacter sp.]
MDVEKVNEMNIESISNQKKHFTFNANDPKVEKFFKNARSNFKMRLYQLWKVPGAFWFRLKVEHVGADKTVVSLPNSWRTQNPFNSIYFVGLLAAAEYSTAIFVYSRVMMADNVKFIVKDVKADFVKKGNARTFFTCDEPQKIDAAVNRAIETGEQQSIMLKSIGKKASGEVVSNVEITWTFKKV